LLRARPEQSLAACRVSGFVYRAVMAPGAWKSVRWE